MTPQIDDALRGQIREMFELMYENRGIGLAANQVALPFRLFVLNTTADPEKKESEQVFINPEIIKRHSSVEAEEGCLSFPGVYEDVQRARKIKVRAYDLEGNEIELDADDLLSRAIQHETDHLSGKLFIDYFQPSAVAKTAAKIKEFEVKFRESQAAGETPTDEEIVKRLRELAGARRFRARQWPRTLASSCSARAISRCPRFGGWSTTGEMSWLWSRSPTGLKDASRS